MSLAADLTAREAEIIRILKSVGSQSDNFVVIGGYAINALTSHRFSVDCDMVTDSEGMRDLQSILKREGYTALSRVKRQQIYGVKIKSTSSRSAQGRSR